MPDPVSQRVMLPDGGTHETTWLTHSQAGQSKLAAAYGSARRPRCLCVDGGVDMVVVQRGQRFHLARMPGTGMAHDPDCPSVDDVNPYSGGGVYAPSALREGADGRLTLLLDPNVSRAERNVPAVSLDGLLDLLLEGSDLNAYRGTADRYRNWTSVRDRLTTAATNLTLDTRGPLADQLLLPLPFEKDAPPGVVDAQCALLAAPAPLRLVCAPLKTIQPSTHNLKMTLKHLPRVSFWINQRAGDRLSTRSDSLDLLNHPPTSALCLAVVRAGRQPNSFTVAALAIRRVDSRFMPCMSDSEAAVAESLARPAAIFLRPLRFDAPWSYPLADYAIPEADRLRMVYVLSPTDSTTIDVTKRSTVNALRQYGTLLSVWDTDKWINPPSL